MDPPSLKILNEEENDENAQKE